MNAIIDAFQIGEKSEVLSIPLQIAREKVLRHTSIVLNEKPNSEQI